MLLGHALDLGVVERLAIELLVVGLCEYVIVQDAFDRDQEKAEVEFQRTEPLLLNRLIDEADPILLRHVDAFGQPLSCRRAGRDPDPCLFREKRP